jgi:hypothetical protein
MNSGFRRHVLLSGPAERQGRGARTGLRVLRISGCSFGDHGLGAYRGCQQSGSVVQTTGVSPARGRPRSRPGEQGRPRQPRPISTRSRPLRCSPRQAMVADRLHFLRRHARAWRSRCIDWRPSFRTSWLRRAAEGVVVHPAETRARRATDSPGKPPIADLGCPRKKIAGDIGSRRAMPVDHTARGRVSSASFRQYKLRRDEMQPLTFSKCNDARWTDA